MKILALIVSTTTILTGCHYKGCHDQCNDEIGTLRYTCEKQAERIKKLLIENEDYHAKMLELDRLAIHWKHELIDIRTKERMREVK